MRPSMVSTAVTDPAADTYGQSPCRTVAGELISNLRRLLAF